MTHCLICGRSLQGAKSGEVVMGQLEGKDFTVHGACFVYDWAALSSRLATLIGWKDDEDNLTQLGRSGSSRPGR